MTPSSAKLFRRQTLLGAVATKLARDIETGAVVPGKHNYFTISDDAFDRAPCCSVGHLTQRYSDAAKVAAIVFSVKARVQAPTAVVDWLFQHIQVANDANDLASVCALLRTLR